MNDFEVRVLEIMNNLNWLFEAHNSFAELLEVKSGTVTISLKGQCAECEINCIDTAFKEWLPDVELIIQ